MMEQRARTLRIPLRDGYSPRLIVKEAEFFIKDIDKRTVNFVPNFDDEEQEPSFTSTFSKQLSMVYKFSRLQQKYHPHGS